MYAAFIKKLKVIFTKEPYRQQAHRIFNALYLFPQYINLQRNALVFIYCAKQDLHLTEIQFKK